MTAWHSPCEVRIHENESDNKYFPQGVENKDFRIVLKVHYCIYPKWALPFGLLMGWLSTNYNTAFRALFLFTISPKTTFEHVSLWSFSRESSLLPPYTGTGFSYVLFDSS